MAEISNQHGDAISRNRIMVIGQDVVTVQRVSRYCLNQGAEVFPYYGVPTADEVTLFNPQVSVLCLPLPDSCLCQIEQPYILWSEQPMVIDVPLVSTLRELVTRLQVALHNRPLAKLREIRSF